MVRSFSFVIVAIAGALAGCVTPVDAAEDVENIASAQTSALEPAVTIDAEWFRAVTRTPTYGDDGMSPFLTINVTVEDDLLRRSRPTFDGFERPFALIPRADGDAVRWERLDLPFRATGLRGYIALRPYDAYETARAVPLSEADLAVISREGIAVGLDTNVGTIWAQNFRENTSVTKRVR